MKTAIELISEERIRQIDKEGYSFKSDAGHTNSQLALAAACYALPWQYRDSIDGAFVPLPNIWPWGRESWKPTPEDRIRELVKAGALVVAEIDRLNLIK